MSGTEGAALELNKLYNMDCMDGMREFPDKFFDLAVVDVPYGGVAKRIMGRGGEKRRSMRAERRDYA